MPWILAKRKNGLVQGVKARFYAFRDRPEKDVSKMDFVTETFYMKIDFVFTGKPYILAPEEKYVIVFTGFLKIDEPGNYVFYVKTSGGVTLFVDGKELIDSWRENTSAILHSEKIFVDKGYHAFRLLYFNSRRFGEISFGWIKPSGEHTVIPTSNLFTTIGDHVFFTGLSNGWSVKLISAKSDEEKTCVTFRGVCGVHLPISQQPFYAYISVHNEEKKRIFATTDPLEIWGGDEYEFTLR